MTQVWEEKLEMAEAFMAAAESLEETPLLKVSGGSAKDQQRYQRKQVCYFLYAIIFELSIKIMWEIERGEKCRHTHKIVEIYRELSCEKQLHIKSLYNNQATIIRTMKKQPEKTEIRNHNSINFQSLDEALESNEDTMINFKYNGIFQGKSSLIGGVIWNNEDSWILPHVSVVFPKELLQYAKENVTS